MSVPNSRSCFSVCARGALWLFISAGAYAAVPSAEYDAVLLDARTGAAAAMERLQDWQRRYPADKRLIYDLATVLGLQGRHQAALEYYPQIVQPEAPAYAIKSIAGSARAAGRSGDAERAYRLLVSRTPADAEAHAGLAYAWMDSGRADDALAYVISRLPRTSSGYSRGDLPLLVALAELREHRKEWLLAADAYVEVLKHEPGFRYALRGRVFALSRAGIAPLAKRLADSRPEFFDDDERWRIEHDMAARAIAFGQARLASDYSPSRFAAIDAALSRNAEVISRFASRPATRFDRLVALRDRMRMPEAAELYQSLVAEDLVIPTYAKAAAADAYLHLEQPEVARDLYLDTLKDTEHLESSESTDRQIGLIYAYCETGQYGEAQVAADALLRRTPAMIHKGIRGLEAPNPDYTRATLIAALVPMYADRPEYAEQRLSAAHALAPANHGIRSAWASLQSARERPRVALEEFTLLQGDDPKSIDAAIGRADTLLALNEFEETRAQLAPLLSNYSENKAVQNLAQKLEQQERPQLRIDATQGHGGSRAAAESVLDVALHSAPLKDSLGEHYRAFTHLTRSNGETAAMSVTRMRVGAGIDYRARDTAVEAELNRATGAAVANGMAFKLSRSLSDVWHIHMGFDSNVNDLAAAAFRQDVTARAFKTGVTWIAHESRKAGGELTQLRFSDENRRKAARLWWTERWISGPAFKLESTLGLYSSSNSRSGGAYFNPTRDREASFALAGEWLTWRRYHRSFRQRLTYAPGYYRQEHFSGGATADLRYEQEWRDDRSLAIRYGFGRSSHPYDGSREDRSYGYLTLNWQIK
ncbi:MAG: hmsH [Burkholderia sp.]|nr:hmsH [Burkholderia sp.]